jgi:hypothetical protein
LRDPHLDDVAVFAANLGRYQPVAVIAGAVLIGLGLSWLLKSPDISPDHTATDGPVVAW